ncbi:hypothetical protein PLICRDRAFT_55693 [Plicaturopsis crispa FD-325 SS-3]|nr:hypothetical protein PLICRDRAFT_55693 [Plicaturopsis crispa FD-325 SS-3]
MHYLCLYLRATGRSWVLLQGAEVFKVIACEVAFGGDRMGALPSTFYHTPPIERT